MFIVIALLVSGIIVSGIMTVKTGREEREIENDFIEQEGNKYITRMNEEKIKRQNRTSEEAS